MRCILCHSLCVSSSTALYPSKRAGVPDAVPRVISAPELAHAVQNEGRVSMCSFTEVIIEISRIIFSPSVVFASV